MFTKILCLALLGLAFVQPGSSAPPEHPLAEQTHDALSQAAASAEAFSQQLDTEMNNGQGAIQEAPKKESSGILSVVRTVAWFLFLPITIPYRIARAFLGYFNINLP